MTNPQQPWQPGMPPPPSPGGYNYGPPAGYPLQPQYPPYPHPAGAYHGGQGPYWQTPPPRRSRTGLWIGVGAGCAVVVLALVAFLAIRGVGGGLLPGGDEAEIKAAVSGFNSAVGESDYTKASTFVCSAEARQIASIDQYLPDGARGSANLLEVDSVTVSGNSATAAVTFTVTSRQGNLKLTKEGGTWKLCDLASLAGE